MAEIEAEVVVNVRRTSLVRPAIPTRGKRMFLSNFDLGWLPINNVQRLFFYSYTQLRLSEYSSLIERMKESLSSVLVHFYPLAGRLKKGGSHGRTQVDCNDKGVEFREATIDIPIQDLENDGFRRKPFFPKLVHEVNLLAEENYTRPLLSIQVTAFEGGGICVGTTYHHVIADGNSFWHFMTSWAECSRGCIPISKPPQHARDIFKRDQQNPRPVSYRAHDIIINGISGAKIFNFVPDNNCGGGNSEKPNEALEKWTELKRKTKVMHSTFCFTEDVIKDLKQRSGASSSFNVAVAAQFWRSVMRARELPGEVDVYFSVLCDCRGRVKPPLPPTYYGNCLSIGLAQTTVDTLINSHISLAAGVIQQAIDSCTSVEQINYLIDWAESPYRDFVSLLSGMGIRN